MSDAQKEHVFFDAVLHPHRSLPPKGFLAVMMLIGVISFVAGGAFLLMGAWPVFGFFGLDVALIYLAFRMTYRAGRMVEHVRLTDKALTIERVHPSGRVQSWRLEPTWAQARMTVSARGRTLRLKSRDVWVEVGKFLPEEERESFADAFSAAQARRRDGMGLLGLETPQPV
ncbi:MAG: DUF2244 domain-containing protein [Candidatus Phaeomarinobacter sp.]